MGDLQKPKVLITSSEYPEAGLEIIRDKCEILQIKSNGFNDKEEARKEIEQAICGVDGVIWCTKIFLDKDLIEKAGSQLKVVSSMSAGVDHIDRDELEARNIKLGNTPDVLNAAVADSAILLMIGAARRLPERLKEVESGKWENGPERMLGQDIRATVVGIIGLGGIGQMICCRLQGFNVRKILYCGRNEKEEVAAEIGAIYTSFDELLEKSDFVFVCCSLNESTKHLMNTAAFSKMKKSAILINISRGDVIDQDALVHALKTKQIYAAGLDVTSPEPLPKDHPLCSLPNCFITPHLGSATLDTRKDMAHLSALNLIMGVQGEPLLTPVF